MKDLQSFRGKLIGVSGSLLMTEELIVLRAGECEHRFVTEGFAWPRYISLVTPSHPARRIDPKEMDIEVDDEAFKLLSEVNSLLHRLKLKRHMFVTVVGKLIVREKYIVHHTDRGAVSVDGFGHLGAAPAMLVVQSVQEVTIR